MSTSNQRSPSYEMIPPQRLARKPLPPSSLVSRNESSSTVTTNTQFQDEPVSNFSPSASLLNRSLTRNEEISSPELEKPVFPRHPAARPETHWLRGPLWMLFPLLLGLVLALSHHFYYMSLNGNRAGSDRQQQWMAAFGQIFAFSTITSLRLAVVYAYGQYLWTVMRGTHFFRIGTVDKLFSLTSDLRGFFSWEIARNATLLWMLAAVTWLIGLGVILPPGTLIVISQNFTHTSDFSLPYLNWTDTIPWLDPTMGGEGVGDLPSSGVTRLVAQTAESMDTLRFPVPAANASYTFPLRGPFMQCEPANSTQLPFFQEYAQNLHDENLWVTASNWNTTINIPESTNKAVPNERSTQLLLLSAFDPTIASWLNHHEGSYNGPDNFNNWYVDLPSNATGYMVPHSPPSNKSGQTDEDFQMVPRQVWVLTANDSIVCTMGNATRDVTVRIVDSEQTISYGPLQDFDPVIVPKLGTTTPELDTTDEQRSFVQQYVAMASFLSGNVTMDYEGVYSNISTLHDVDSNIFLTGLVACDEFVHTYWDDNPVVEIQAELKKRYVVKEPPHNALGNATTDTIFEAPSWMCRNRTLARAIEDLSANITIGFMTSSDFTSPNGAIIPLLTTSPQNLYHYKPLFLILSYAISSLFALLCTMLGLYAFGKNGMVHSSKFSAVVGMTRGLDVDILGVGGMSERGAEVEQVRLRVGGTEGRMGFEVRDQGGGGP